jgi:prepilin-type N-terminal cleavage/methylation domain-containing protein
MKCHTSKIQKGFTLIELLVVIAIIGLLASVVLAALGSSRTTARDTSRVQAVKELQKALELYRNANAGNYPCATAGCAGNAAAGVAINVGSNQVTTDIASFFRPQAEAILTSIAVAGSASLTSSAASILYRVGSTAGNETSPNRNTYTILLRREQNVGAIAANTWCSISGGAGHTSWNNSTAGQYPPCF